MTGVMEGFHGAAPAGSQTGLEPYVLRRSEWEIARSK
jgi:hypothetical protein